MAKLKVGLGFNRTSYFDPITNTYLTLDNPIADIKYNENDVEGTVKYLEGITHALLCSVPALKLYEGKLPDASIEHWNNKYLKMFKTDMNKKYRTLTGDIKAPDKANRAFDRAEQINGKSNIVDDKDVQEEEIIDDTPQGDENNQEDVEIKAAAVETKEVKKTKRTSRKSTKKAKADE